jgi:hypothetical protein
MPEISFRSAALLQVRRELLTRNLLSPRRRIVDSGGPVATARCPMQAIGWLRETRLVHVWSTSLGTERLLAVSNGPSLVQVAGVILEKQTRAQNPDKDEVPGSGPGGAVRSRLCRSGAGHLA